MKITLNGGNREALSTGNSADDDLAYPGFNGSIMSLKKIIAITTEPLSLIKLLQALSVSENTHAEDWCDPNIGALVTFSGIVREQEGDHSLESLEYEAYAEMAEKEMEKLVDSAGKKWPLKAVGLVHRTGSVPKGESSVLVVVAAGHRAESFEAARFLIDELKKKVPIWKKART